MGSQSCNSNADADNEDSASDSNIFDYKIRDNLRQKCKEMKVRLSQEIAGHDVLLDVITLVSDGDHEAAVRNLQETVNFMANYKTSINRLLDPSTIEAVPLTFNESQLEYLYWNMIYQFWKTYVIKVLVSHRRKIKPKFKPYESLKRSLFFVNHTSSVSDFLSASTKEKKRLCKIQKDLDAEYHGKPAVLEDKILKSDIQFE